MNDDGHLREFEVLASGRLRCNKRRDICASTTRAYNIATTHFSLACQKLSHLSFAASPLAISIVCPLLLKTSGYVTQSRCAFKPVPPKLHQASTYCSSQIASTKRTHNIDFVCKLDRPACRNTATDRTHSTAAATPRTSNSILRRSRTSQSPDTRHHSKPATAPLRHKHIHNSMVQDSLLQV